MKTFVVPTTRVRLEDSGGIKTIARKQKISSDIAKDETSVVHLPEDQYRLVLHCRRDTDRITMEELGPNQ